MNATNCRPDGAADKDLVPEPARQGAQAEEAPVGRQEPRLRVGRLRRLVAFFPFSSTCSTSRHNSLITRCTDCRARGRREHAVGRRAGERLDARVEPVDAAQADAGGRRRAAAAAGGAERGGVFRLPALRALPPPAIPALLLVIRSDQRS